MPSDNYRKAIEPYMSWFKEQIEKNSATKKGGSGDGGGCGDYDGYIIVKIKDVKDMMGEEFLEKQDKTVYSMLRDLFLENGIKVTMNTHIDGDKLLVMSKANVEEVMTTQETRRIRTLRTAKNKGFETTADYFRSTLYGRGVSSPHSENKECTRYFGDYIEREYVMRIFENVVPLKKELYSKHLRRPYDYECKNGFKLKHVASCIRIDSSHEIPYWGFLIKRNNIPDYWVLSAWDDRESLNPKYVWIIRGDEIFVTQVSRKPFYDRESLTVYATKKSIERMSKYDATSRLEQLKDICNVARTNR